MGKLIEGQWRPSGMTAATKDGKFVREETSFRDWVRRGDPDHPAEPGRYHLYVANACPWAHRTLIYRSLLDLDDAISVSVVHPHMLEQGWHFSDDHPDHLFGASHLHEVYTRADPEATTRVTVPVLWDKEKQTIVNNESAEIIRMLDEEFAPDHAMDLRPEPLRDAIDEVNARVYDDVNNGVYKCGFATKQEAYDEAVTALFDALDWLEARLEGKTFLFDERLTEADVRLFTTLLRFDPVYYVHFKCSKRRIADYPNLWALTRRIYQMPAVKKTVHLPEIREHYYYSHESINPHRIVPIEPDLGLDAPID